MELDANTTALVKLFAGAVEERMVEVSVERFRLMPGINRDYDQLSDEEKQARLAVNLLPSLPDETLAAWEPELGDCAAYWQLRFWSAKRFELHQRVARIPMQPRPYHHILEAHARGVADADTYMLLTQVIKDATTPIDRQLEIASMSCHTHNPEHHDAMQGIMESDLVEKQAQVLGELEDFGIEPDGYWDYLVEIGPELSYPYYYRSVQRTSDDTQLILDDWERGNSALENRMPEYFPDVLTKSQVPPDSCPQWLAGMLQLHTLGDSSHNNMDLSFGLMQKLKQHELFTAAAQSGQLTDLQTVLTMLCRTTQMHVLNSPFAADSIVLLKFLKTAGTKLSRLLPEPKLKEVRRLTEELQLQMMRRMTSLRQEIDWDTYDEPDPDDPVAYIEHMKEYYSGQHLSHVETRQSELAVLAPIIERCAQLSFM